MTEPLLVKDLLSLPEHIRKGDFVVKLAEGIDDPKATAATYKVTKHKAHERGLVAGGPGGEAWPRGRRRITAYRPRLRRRPTRHHRPGQSPNPSSAASTSPSIE